MKAQTTPQPDAGAIVRSYIKNVYAAQGATTVGGEIAMRPQYADLLWNGVRLVLPFFELINTPLVVQSSGPLLYPTALDSIAKRTAITPSNPRNPADPKTGREYQVVGLEIDPLTPWDQLGAMSSRGADAFREEYQRRLAWHIGSDMLRVAFQGQSRATGDANTYQTVDASWVEKLRVANASRVMSEVVPGSGIITAGPQQVMQIEGAANDNGDGTVGFPVTAHGRPAGAEVVISGTTNYDGTYLVESSSTANRIDVTVAYQAEDTTGATITHTPDYAHLDALVADLRGGITAELRPELSALIAADVLGEEELRLYSSGTGSPGEKAVVRESLTSFGGVPLTPMPYVLDGQVIVTPLRNLSMYRKDTWRRAIEMSNPFRGVIDWNFFEITPEVENLDAAMVAENVVITS